MTEHEKNIVSFVATTPKLTARLYQLSEAMQIALIDCNFDAFRYVKYKSKKAKLYYKLRRFRKKKNG